MWRPDPRGTQNLDFVARLDAWHHAELDALRERGEDTPEACEELDNEYARRLRAYHSEGGER